MRYLAERTVERLLRLFATVQLICPSEADRSAVDDGSEYGGRYAPKLLLAGEGSLECSSFTLIVLFYFRKNEQLGLRIGFVISSVLYYILFIFVLSAYLYVRGLV
ncbi:hypothetical protein [Paenibacillus terrae]